MTIIDSPYLTGAFVTLHPFRSKVDVDYFIQLALKNNKENISEGLIRAWVELSGQEFWFAMVNGICVGAIGYFKIKDRFVLEGLRDPEVKNSIIFSIDAAKTLMDYMFTFTDRIETSARKDDKAIRILCRKLDFKQTDIVSTPYGEMVWFEKRKSCL
jgi:hypothetical protein